MPTPIGHALAGIAVAWSAESPTQPLRPGRSCLRPLTLVCVALAVLPDADLLYPPIHRTVTHSISTTILVTIIAAAVTAWVTGRISWRIVLACAAAHASHLLTDWLGTDRSYAPFGIQMFWPFGSGWYMSGWDIFLRVERRDPFSWPTLQTNLAAALREILVLGPVMSAIWLVRRRTKKLRD